MAAADFDPVPFHFHAVDGSAVKGRATCAYAATMKVDCEFIGESGRKHYHCTDCGYATYSTKNVRGHFGAHANKRKRGVCLQR